MDITNFKDSVCIVEIENNSFCNRKCVYCINNYIDRLSENHIMQEELFKKIINELSSIDYDRELTFHRYNEPFYEKNDMILERISYARRKLPKATLETSSNGDYLDAEYVRKIKEAGLDKLHIQCHHNNCDMIEESQLKNEIMKLNRKIGGFKGKFYTKTDSFGYIAVDSGFKALTIRSTNFLKVGYSRGEIVKTTKKHRVEGPCFNPYLSFPIDYNGNVCICHSTVSYHESHKDYVIGNCMNQTIFEIYGSDKALELRRHLMQGKREKICQYCHGSLTSRLKKYGLHL